MKKSRITPLVVVLCLATVAGIFTSVPVQAHSNAAEDGSDRQIDWYDHGYFTNRRTFTANASRDYMASCAGLNLVWDNSLSESQNRGLFVDKIVDAVSNIVYYGTTTSQYSVDFSASPSESICAISIVAQMIGYHNSGRGSTNQSTHYDTYLGSTANLSYEFIQYAICQYADSAPPRTCQNEGYWSSVMRSNTVSMERRNVTYTNHNWASPLFDFPASAGSIYFYRDPMFIPFGSDLIAPPTSTVGPHKYYSLPSLVIRHADGRLSFQVLEGLSIPASPHGGQPQPTLRQGGDDGWQLITKLWVDTSYVDPSALAHCVVSYDSARDTYRVPYGCRIRLMTDLDLAPNSTSNLSGIYSVAYKLTADESPYSMAAMLSGNILRGPSNILNASSSTLQTINSSYLTYVYFGYWGPGSLGGYAFRSHPGNNINSTMPAHALDPHNSDLLIRNDASVMTPEDQPICYFMRITSSAGPTYLRTAYTPTMESPNRICMDVTDPDGNTLPPDGEWVYEPTTVLDASQSRVVAPGDSVNVSGFTSNTGISDGPEYEQVVRVSRGNVSGSTSFSDAFSTGILPGNDGPLQDEIFIIDMSNTVGDEICFVTEVSPVRGTNSFGAINITDAGPTTSAEECVKVGETPYLEVYGADVWAGGVWDPAVEGSYWCSLISPQTTADAFIRSSRRNGVGAFVEYAATALYNIESFATTLSENQDLTFQNFTDLGHFNTEGKCVTDYFEYLSKDISNPGVSSFANGGSLSQTGQFFANGARTLSASTIGSNQMILIVDGDVSINGNITYGNYSVTDPDELPFFMLVASGSIDISGNVTELDGAYISKGEIDTCSDGGARLSISICQQQLIVNGSFIANDIQFRRTFSGTVRNASGADDQGAELFRFSPEMYIADPPFVSDYARSFKVDQIKDLPPVY